MYPDGTIIWSSEDICGGFFIYTSSHYTSLSNIIISVRKDSSSSHTRQATLHGLVLSQDTLS